MHNNSPTTRLLNNALTIAVLVLATRAAAAAAAATQLTVSPRQMAAEIGTDVVFTCSDSSGQIPASSIHWNFTTAGDTDTTTITTTTTTTTNVTTPRLTSRNGTLTIRSVVLSDAGRYTCVNVSDSDSGNGTTSSSQGPSAQLVVYAMPDYVQYGVVLLAVTGALLLVAAVSQTVKLQQDRARRRRPKRSEKTKQRSNTMQLNNYAKPSTSSSPSEQ